jgi:hypothetical protein
MRRIHQTLSLAGAVALLGALTVAIGPLAAPSSGAAQPTCVSRPEAGIWTGTWSSSLVPVEQGTWSGAFAFSRRAPFRISGLLTIAFTSPVTESGSSEVTGTVSCEGTWNVTASSAGETFSGTVAGGTSVSGTWSLLPPRDDSGPWSGSIKPTVLGLSPSTGPVAGGTTVKIRGSGFGGVTAVDFGSTPAAILKVNKKGTVLKVTAPHGTSTGSVPVLVTTPVATSSLSPSDLFTYH